MAKFSIGDQVYIQPPGMKIPPRAMVGKVVKIYPHPEDASPAEITYDVYLESGTMYTQREKYVFLYAELVARKLMGDL